MNLEDRVILVTGGGRRLGRAIASTLGRAGAWVAVHHHASGDGAREVVTELGGRGATFEADLSDANEAAGLVDRVIADRGRLDGLVLNAAMFAKTPFGTVRESDWDRVFAVNLKSPFFLAQRAAPALKKAHGAALLISDVSAENPWVDYLPYCLTKAGIDGLTRALAKVLAPEARANAIAPGPALPAAGGDPADHAAIAETTLLGRFGDADDIADTAKFLMEADYVTGHIIAVDGGQRVNRDRPTRS